MLQSWSSSPSKSPVQAQDVDKSPSCHRLARFFEGRKCGGENGTATVTSVSCIDATAQERVGAKRCVGATFFVVEEGLSGSFLANRKRDRRVSAADFDVSKLFRFRRRGFPHPTRRARGTATRLPTQRTNAIPIPARDDSEAAAPPNAPQSRHFFESATTACITLTLT